MHDNYLAQFGVLGLIFKLTSADSTPRLLSEDCVKHPKSSTLSEMIKYTEFDNFQKVCLFVYLLLHPSTISDLFRTAIAN